MLNEKTHYKYMTRKKNYTPIIAVVVLIIVWYLFIGKDLLSQIGTQAVSNGNVKEKVYYDFPCSEANLARILSITLDETIGEQGENSETEDALWYEKYYKSIEGLGVTGLKLENAFDILSSEKFVAVLGELTEVNISIKESSQLKLYEVLDYYQKILQEKNKPMEYKSLTILATPTDEQDLSGWQMFTTSGIFEFEGLVVDPLKNKTIQIACVGEQLLGVVEIEGEESYLEECKVVAVDEQQAEIEILGKTLSFGNKVLKSEDVGKEGSMVVDDGQIIEFIAKSEQGASSLNTIRVLLSSGSGQYIQDDVALSVKEDYDLVFNEKVNTLMAGEVWKASNFNWEEIDCIKLVPKNNEQQLTIESIEKSGAHPSYYGTIEVIKLEKGYRLINEVDIEKYVAGVLPSEMPTSYGIEALKAQAVAIRTYGAACIASGKFMEYGAHVDDTTASQVYNRIPADELAIQAAQQTAGLLLKSDGKLISNKFFATSCGYTANFGEVWAGATFPSNSPTYLVASQQYVDGPAVESLSEEEAFKTFIMLGEEDIDAFDEASPWFRWKVTLDRETLSKLIEPALSKLGSSYSTLMSYVSKDGNKELFNGQEIGDIYSLEVVERGEGGNAMSLNIEGANGSIIVQTEYLIRSLFASNDNQSLSVKRNNGTTVTQMTLLPSAFFMIEQEQNEDGLLQELTLIGGGNGHGVGLSQDGAKGMAERGFSYKEILEHYYKNCEITQ